jgi:hypothetical protein
MSDEPQDDKQQKSIDFSAYAGNTPTPKTVPSAEKAPDSPGLLDRADTAITSALEPNPKNYGSLVRTNAIEVPKTLGREVYAAGKSILGAPAAMYHAIADAPADLTEPALDPVQRAVYRSVVKPVVTAAQDYSSGKVTPESALSVAPEAIGQGAGTVIGGKLADMAVPKVITAATKLGAEIRPVPLAPEMAARGITKAVNPAVNEWPSYIKATAEEAGNIKAFAEKNNLPLKTQLDWAKAARGAADESRGYYQEKVLGPNADEQVSTAGTNFKGKNAGESQTATIGEVNKRITDINDELRSAYQKKEAGQTREALANEPELKAEQQALTQILYKELGQRTGLQPEQVAAIRQRFGKQYSIADQTEAAVNQRQSSAGKMTEGRRDVPTTATGTAVDLFNKVVRGGPEGISNRAFGKSLNQSGGIPITEMPAINPPAPVPGRGIPAWQMRTRLGTAPEGTAIPVEETSPTEIQNQQTRLSDRAAANEFRRNSQPGRRIPLWQRQEQSERAEHE